MRLPILARPVKRPDIIYPHRSVDVTHGRFKDLLQVRMDLLHGANYNDPPYFEYPEYQDLISSDCSCLD